MFVWLKNCSFIKKEAVGAKNCGESTFVKTNRITIRVLFRGPTSLEQILYSLNTLAKNMYQPLLKFDWHGLSRR